ncbi:tetratricopeptide repeat protein [Clostridium tyrobutyricum]|uniref:tetratricopeptide repeat protein n=1 Tax=Clostridium tyrobutyricum TaxID=1519 RepID=UPI001C38125A|nr:tetratricopeptide repeat protein [Clostridium tyrobutyricum]MBV4450106.1 tetratricopeptide repeat protein [Clostridium tyrobutyricum]
MRKQKLLKIAILIVVLIVLFIGTIFAIYKYSQKKNFNDLVNSASKKLYAGDYDDAIKLYNQALSYKDDNNVKIQISLAQGYKQNQRTYNEGLKLMSDKKYSEAIKKFSTINQNSGQIYNNSQSKISECKKDIINENIKSANNAIENENYDIANSYINDILKIDNKNEEAVKLKGTIAKSKEEKNQNSNIQHIQQNNNDNNKSKIVKSKEGSNSQNSYQQFQVNQNAKLFQDKINSINNQIERQHDITENLAKGSEKRRASLLKEIELTEQRIKLYQDSKNK